MQCFEARKSLVDFADGSLKSAPSAELQEHVASCTHCSSDRDRVKQLLSILHHQPRAKLSPELREDPLGMSLPKLIRQNSPRRIWRSLPVGARLLFEGVTIAAVVMLGIHLGPRLRALYEEQMDRRLQKMIAAEDAGPDGAVPLARNAGIDASNLTEDHYGNEGEESEVATSSSSANDDDLHVGKSEIWRFNLKTDSPTLVRAQIIKALRDAKIPDSTPGFGGLEAPGGIQFDLLVPVTVIPELKTNLEKLAPPRAENLPFSETFTWYKNRSKKPIPPGQARIVIWLSQI